MTAGRGGGWSLWRCGWLICVCLLSSSHGDGGVYHQLKYDFAEEQPAGSVVGNVRADARLELDALDAEVLARVRFTQRQRNRFFVVDETSGDVSSTRRIDREILCPYVVVCEQVLEVTVTPVALFQLVRVVISIVDINDHDPIFPTDWLTLDVIETTQVNSYFRVVVCSKRCLHDLLENDNILCYTRPRYPDGIRCFYRLTSQLRNYSRI